MTSQNNRYSHYLHIILSLGVFFISFVYINFRLDLRPNSIMVLADLRNTYLPPEIYLNTGLGFEESPINAGDITHQLLEPIKAFRMIVNMPPLLTPDQFALKDFQIDNHIAEWEAFLPDFIFNPEKIRSLAFEPLDPADNYHLEIAGFEWPSSKIDDGLVFHNPGLTVDGPTRIRIFKTEPVFSEDQDPRSLTPKISNLVALESGMPPVHIYEITLAKRFGRLGLTIPLHVWQAEDLIEQFSITNTAQITDSNGSFLELEPGQAGHIGLEYQGTLTPIYQAISSTIRQYRWYLNAAALVFSLVFYLALGWLIQWVKDHHERFRPLLNRLTTHLQKATAFLRRNDPIRGITISLGVFLVILSILAIALFQRLQPGNLTLRVLGVIVFALVLLVLIVKFSARNEAISATTRVRTTIPWDRIIVFGLIFIGTLTLFHRLGDFELREDEFQVVDAAAGYLNTGTYYRWDWAAGRITDLDTHNSYSARYYDRAWPHTWLIAQSFQLFGISEWSARLVSVLSGLFFFILLYWVTRRLTSKPAAVLVLLAAVLNPDYIDLFRHTRMYALLLPLSLILAYCLYRAITGDWHPRTGVNWLDGFIERNLNFDYRFALAALPVLYLAYLIHVNVLVIPAAALFYICILALVDKSKKYRIAAGVGLALIAMVSGLIILRRLFDLPGVSIPFYISYIAPFSNWHSEYLRFLFAYPFGLAAGLGLMVGSGLKWYQTRHNPALSNKSLFLLSIVLFSALFFMLIAERDYRYFYSAHITPFALMLIMGGLWQLGQTLFSKPTVIILPLVVLMTLTPFMNSWGFLYADEHIFGHYSSAYRVMREQYQPDEVIFGQYLRTYYLADLGDYQHITMLKDGAYTYEEFLADLEAYPAGWLTWETRKAYHLDERIIAHAEQYFFKIHGDGLDETRIEVYYYAHDPRAGQAAP